MTSIEIYRQTESRRCAKRIATLLVTMIAFSSFAMIQNAEATESVPLTTAEVVETENEYMFSEFRFYAIENSAWNDVAIQNLAIGGRYQDAGGTWFELQLGDDFTIGSSLYSFNSSTNAYDSVSSGSLVVGGQYYARVIDTGAKTGTAGAYQYVGPFMYKAKDDIAFYAARANKSQFRPETPISFPMLYAEVYRVVNGEVDALSIGSDFDFVDWCEIVDGEYSTCNSELSASFASSGTYYAHITGRGSYTGDVYLPFNIAENVNNSNCQARARVDTAWTNTKYNVDKLGVELYEQNPLTFEEQDLAIGSDFDFSGWYFYDDIYGYDILSDGEEYSFDVPGLYYLKFTGRADFTGDTIYLPISVSDSWSISLYRCDSAASLWADQANVSYSDLGVELNRSMGIAGVFTVPTDCIIFEGWYREDGSGGLASLGSEANNGPNAPGSYIARIKGANGYSGSRDIAFEILDEKDISNYSHYSTGEIWASGPNITVEDLGVRFYKDDVSADNILSLEAYSFVGWYAGDGETLLSDAAESGPASPGSYYAVFEGSMDNGYRGMKYVGFSVMRADDLSCYGVDIASKWIEGGASRVTISDVSPSVHRSAQPGEEAADGRIVLTQSDYAVVALSKYIPSDDVNGEGAWCEESESFSGPGYYRARVEGRNSFQGTYGFGYFNAYDLYDLSNYGATADSIKEHDFSNANQGMLNLSVSRYDDASHQAVILDSTRYEVEGFYVASSGERLDCFPQSAGDYYVIVKGKSPFDGIATAFFSIIDLNVLQNWNGKPYGKIWNDITYDADALLKALDFRIFSQEEENPTTFLDSSNYTFEGWYVGSVHGEVVQYDRLADGLLPIADSRSYYARFMGGREYSGDLYIPFSFRNSLDVADYLVLNSSISGSRPSVTHNGQAVTLARLGITLSRQKAAGVTQALLEGKDFVVAGWYSDSGEKLSNAPSEVGDYSVTLSGLGDYSGSSASVSFSIVDEGEAPSLTSISDAVIEIADQTYTGSAMMPKATIKLNGSTLKPDVDFAVSYKDNVNVGTATVTVTGKGNYTGTKSATFKINAAALSDATILELSDKTYTGKPQIQNPTVKFGGMALTFGTDYALDYKHNINAGSATVTVTGKGNYIGTKSATFAIVKANNPIAVKVKSPSVKAAKVKKSKRSIIAKKAFVVSKAQGEITYEKVCGNKKITVSNAGKITVKKGLKKGKYKVKVRIIAMGNANYNPGSKTVTVKVKVK